MSDKYTYKISNSIHENNFIRIPTDANEQKSQES